MEIILTIREVIVKFIKRFEVILLPILKFILGYFVFSAIHNIGRINPALLPFMDEIPVYVLNALFALLFTVMPMNLSWLLIILDLTLQFSSSIEIAIVVFLFTLFIFLFYARMAPKESLFILFTLIAFHFNIPYVIPIVAGLYFSVTVIIPITIGIFVHAQIPILLNLTTPGTIANMTDMEIADLLTELPAAFTEIYTALTSSLAATQTWIFTAVIFALVVILVHFVSRASIDFAREVAVGLGCVMIVFGFILSVLVAGEQANIAGIVLWTILSGFLALIICFFDSVLDYSRVETVNFEDDENFYHVKIVPKVIMTKSHRVVKRIRPTTTTESELES